MSNNKNRKRSRRKPIRKFNAEGLAALRKCRLFIYLTFAFDFGLFFYHPIASLFHVRDQRILYGFVLMVACQVLVSFMHLVKYASTIEEFVPPEQKKFAVMYAARSRFFILMQYVVLAVILINSIQYQNLTFNTVLVFGSIVLVALSLQNITILQRRFL